MCVCVCVVCDVCCGDLCETRRGGVEGVRYVNSPLDNVLGAQR